MVKNIHDSLYFLIAGYEPLFRANTSRSWSKAKKKKFWLYDPRLERNGFKISLNLGLKLITPPYSGPGLTHLSQFLHDIYLLENTFTGLDYE